jgi:hypothetical protein
LFVFNNNSIEKYCSIEVILCIHGPECFVRSDSLGKKVENPPEVSRDLVYLLISSFSAKDLSKQMEREELNGLITIKYEGGLSI